MDRWSPATWRAHVETCVEMRNLGWKVRSVCGACRLEMWVDLDALVKARGLECSLWNRSPKCRRIGCDGKVAFYAKIPGNPTQIELRTREPAKPARFRRGSGLF